MKKGSFLIFVVFITPFIGNAQENGIDRKGRFHFSLGPEYRITPFYNYETLGLNESNYSGYTNIDQQNSGIAVNVNVEYFITKNLGVGFGNSFRYDLVNAEFSSIEQPFGVAKATHKLLFDHHFYLSYHFKVFKRSGVYLQAGVSFMNTNSEFSVKETEYDSNGDVLSEGFTVSDFTYSANKIEIGYKKGVGKVYAGLYTTIQAPYFDATTRFNIPYVGCSFDIGKL